MCVAYEVECVKTAVSHCDRTLGTATVMTPLLKCDNSAELKGQSCHSGGEKAGWSGVLEEAAGVHRYTTPPQKCHVTRVSLSYCFFSSKWI